MGFVFGRVEAARAAEAQRDLQARADRSEARAAAVEAQLAGLLDALPDGVAMVTITGHVTRANARMASLLGTAPKDRLFVELARDPALAEAMARALSGNATSLELDLRHRLVAMTLAPLPGAGAVVSARDVTEVRRIEAARRDFVSNASHELRTPVSAIAGAAETLLSGALSDTVTAQGFVEMIARHAERLARLTGDLLDLSRLESGAANLERESLDAAALARSVLELVRHRAESGGVALAIEAPAVVEVSADRRRLEQVLVNLLDNAIKYTPSNGRVNVRVIRSGERGARVEVADTGHGIEPHQLERIFERFYRVDSGRSRDAGGTGLGLALVKHLVQAHGGEVGAASSSAGSTFWFTVP